MFIQIVIYNQSMHTVIPEILPHSAPGIRRNVLQWRRVRSRSYYNNGVIHRLAIFKSLYNFCNGGHLLPDCHVNAINSRLALVNYGIYKNRGFPCLPVADNKFTLASSDRDHGVNCLDAGLQWLFHRLSFNYVGGRTLNVSKIISNDRPFPINRLTQGIHNAAQDRKS